MKFTTNLERYLFAKVCEKEADRMLSFCMQKESQYPGGSIPNVRWHNSVNKWLRKSNFWAKVAEHFEDAAFEGISNRLKLGLASNGILPRKEA